MAWDPLADWILMAVRNSCPSYSGTRTCAFL